MIESVRLVSWRDTQDPTLLVSAKGFEATQNHGAMQFEIALQKPTALGPMQVQGPMQFLLLQNLQDKTSIRFQLGSAPDLTPYRHLRWTHVTIEFRAVERNTVLRATLAPADILTDLGPLHECLKTLEEDLVLRCDGGEEVRINSAVALANSDMLKAAQSAGTPLKEVDLTAYPKSVVQQLRDMMLTRELPPANVTPALVHLMHLMLITGRDNVWPAARTQITTKNVMAWMMAAEQLNDKGTVKAAMDFIRRNINNFEVADVTSLCAGLKPKN